MIKKYTKKDGSTAYMFVAYLGVDPITGKQKRTTRRGFKTKREATLAEAKLQTEIEENGFGVAPKKMTFKEVYKAWLPIYESTVKESTLQIQINVIEKHILPHFENMSVDKITTHYYQTITNKWYTSYVKFHNLIGLTQRILEYAVTVLKLIKVNPMVAVIRPKRKRNLKDEVYQAPYYDAEQLAHFLRCVKAMNNPQEYIMFRVIAYTGIRQGEMCGLRWSDFDELNGTLSIRRTVARGKDYKKIIQTPKTIAGERVIPLDKQTIKDLKEWRKIQREMMLLHGYNTNSPEQYIITNEFNDFQYAAHPYAVLKKVRKTYKIDPITVHGLRHTHVCLLLEAGVSVKEVQDRMGHESTDMVLEVYSHINKKKKKEIGNIFAEHVSQNH